MDELKHEVAIADPDIICIAEFKPKNGKTPDPDILSIDGYTLFMNKAYVDPDTRGVCVYTKDYLQVNTTNNSELNETFKDSIWLEIDGNQGKKLLFSCIYRSGTQHKALELDPQLHQTISKMTSKTCYSETIIIGDFNHPKIKWKSTTIGTSTHIIGESTSRHDQAFLECVEDSLLNQHLLYPTRIRGTQNPTQDDLLFSRYPDSVEDITYKAHVGNTDHLTIQFEINFNITQPTEIKKPRLNYLKTNTIKFQESMNKNWKELISDKTPEEAYSIFLAAYNQAIADSVPTTYVSTSTKYHKPIWMKLSTLQLIKKKHNMLIRFLNTRKDSDREAYKKIRNEVSHQTKSDRIQYEKRIAEESKHNINAFWKYVHSTRKTRRSIPDLKKPDGTLTSNDAEKAEILNKQFTSVFTSEDLSDMPKLTPVNIIQELTEINITDESVTRKLKKLRSDKAPGPDGVHPHILKTFAENLGPILSIIYNLSLKNRSLPTIWKHGTISALYKKDNKSLAKNYRPVSLTSVVCKSLESMIVDAIVDHITFNDLKNKYQHGFTKGKSTITNLISALNIWSEALAHGLPVDIIYLDFEKAFDKVPHQRLLDQLHNHGIRGGLLGWITNFLANRTQAVKVNNSSSSSTPVLSGVPQGSVLGPILFLIYVSQISEHLNNFTSLFADDTKLFSYILDSDDPNLNDCSTSSIQDDINNLTYWAEKMQMSFNLGKCHIMHLGSTNPHQQYVMYKTSDTITKPKSISYNLIIHPLETVSYEKDLGIIVDDKLKFTEHISHKLSIANKMIQVIRHTFKHLSPETFKKLYISLVRPHIEYGTPVWSPLHKKDIIRIEKMQRRATRMVPSLRQLPYNDRLRELQLPTLHYRRIRQDLIFLYNITQNNISVDTKTYCKKCTVQDMLIPSDSNTRGHDKRFRIQHHQGIRYQFYTSRVLPVWNALQSKTVNATSINMFKNHLSRDPAMPNAYDFQD